MKWIATTNELELFVSQIAQESFVAIDTEFLRETTYWPVLGLIQLATPSASALIDPCAPGLALDTFFELMQRSDIVKVFHAAYQDIEIIYHLSGRLPRTIFDTQIAAMVLGYGESVSYEQLVAKLLKINLDKSLQYTNWLHRPLSERQKEYALADVTYLCDVYLNIKKQLQKAQREEWIKEEMALLTEESLYKKAPEQSYKRIKGRFKPLEFLIVKKLAAWRESHAQTKNLARRRVLKDEVILEVASQKPKTEKEFLNLRSVRHPSQNKYCAEILQLVREALETPQTEWPKMVHPQNLSEDQQAYLELAKLLVKLVAYQNKIAPKLLTNSVELTKLIHGEELEALPVLHGWRKKLVGEKLIALREGRLALTFQNNKITFLENL